jgi:CO dehydrogenase/acetyl-CoA synthase beta subunit
MEFSDAVSNPSILDKTEEEEEEDDEEEEKSVEQECTTSVPEDTEASGLRTQADKPKGAEHRGIKNMLYKCTVVSYVYKTEELLLYRGESIIIHTKDTSFI